MLVWRKRVPCCGNNAALGTAVFFGMIGVTAFGLIFTPTFYVVCRTLADRIASRRRGAAPVLVPAE